MIYDIEYECDVYCITITVEISQRPLELPISKVIFLLKLLTLFGQRIYLLIHKKLHNHGRFIY